MDSKTGHKTEVEGGGTGGGGGGEKWGARGVWWKGGEGHVIGQEPHTCPSGR